MMRFFYLLLSLALHAALVAALVLLPSAEPEKTPPVPVYQVDLVTLRPKPAPPPPKAVHRVKNSAPPAAKVTAAPKPKPMEPEAPPRVQPAAAARVQDTGGAEVVRLKQGSTFRVQSANGSVSETTITDNWRTIGIRALGVRHFTPDEFVAHYEIKPGRFVSILDGRDSLGGLVLFDSETARMYPLTQFSRMIYTYADSPGGPVQGSVTFLPSRDHTPDVPAPSRILWQDGDSRAYIGTKIYFHEENVQTEEAETTLAGRLILPPGPGPHPAVVLLCGLEHEPPCLAHGFGRILASLGVAAMVSHLREGENVEHAAHAALGFLKGHAAVDPGRMGLWVQDKTAPETLFSAWRRDAPGFLVVSGTHGPASARPASIPTLRLPPEDNGPLLQGHPVASARRAAAWIKGL